MITTTPTPAEHTSSSSMPHVLPRRVLSQIDIKPREWPGNLVLAASFVRGNMGSFEPMFGGPTWSKGHSSFFQDPPGPADLILTPGYGVTRTRHKLVEKFRSRSRLVAWHGEQIYGPWAYDNKLNLPWLSEYTRHMDAHFVWGPEMASLLHSQCGIPPEGIYIVGNPKFDVLRPPLWRRVSPERRKVLFVSDLLLADVSPNQYKKFASTKFLGSEILATIPLYREARHSFIDTVAAVARAAPNEPIVVRVHPGERLDAYEGLSQLANISLDSAQRPFLDALAETKVVLQFTSTSYFETRVADIPTYCLDLIGWRGDHVHQTYYPWITPDELSQHLPEILAGTHEMRSRQPVDAALASLFSHDQGSSLPRILAAINAVCDISRPPEWKPTDLLSMATYLLAHKAKELSARAVLRGSSLGLGRWADRVDEAQRRYQEGPNFIDPAETAREVQDFIDTHPAYLTQLLAAAKSCEFSVTEVGTLVTCPSDHDPSSLSARVRPTVAKPEVTHQ